MSRALTNGILVVVKSAYMPERSTPTLRRFAFAYTVTIDDSQTYTKRWKNERVLTLLKTPLLEYSCEENNKSLWDGRIKAWGTTFRKITDA